MFWIKMLVIGLNVVNLLDILVYVCVGNGMVGCCCGWK